MSGVALRSRNEVARYWLGTLQQVPVCRENCDLVIPTMCLVQSLQQKKAAEEEGGRRKVVPVQRSCGWWSQGLGEPGLEAGFTPTPQ